MPKYKVKPYENYVTYYAGSKEVKKVYTADEVVDIDDIENDKQGYKVVPCRAALNHSKVEQEVKKTEETKKPLQLDTPSVSSDARAAAIAKLTA